MGYAWETTDEDVDTVLKAHDIVKDEDQLLNTLDKLDLNVIEKDVLLYNTLDGQIASMFSNIEDQLMKLGTIKGTDKKFHTIEETDED